MINKSDLRIEILEYFNTIKLNKNCYFEGFYKKRGTLDLYHKLIHYHDGHPILEHVGISQKLWHIKYDTDVVPPFKFVNLGVGYRRGGIRRKRTTPRKPYNTGKSYKYLENSIRCASKLPKVPAMTRDELAECIKSYMKTVRLKQFSDNKDAIISLCYYSELENIPHLHLFVHLMYGESLFCPYCNSLKHISKGHRFIKTCNNTECKLKALVAAGKLKDITYLQTDYTRQKRVDTRRANGNPWHSAESTARRAASNKLYWTPERKLADVAKRREEGVYLKSSATMKQKILDGTFTPKSTNRLNHKRLISTITGIKNYRSSWELKYHEEFTHLLYEKIRIPYILDEKMKVYIVDFVDPITNTLIEIKPKSQTETKMAKAKELAAIEWCKINKYTYKIVTEDDYEFK